MYTSVENNEPVGDESAIDELSETKGLELNKEANGKGGEQEMRKSRQLVVYLDHERTISRAISQIGEPIAIPKFHGRAVLCSVARA